MSIRKGISGSIRSQRSERFIWHNLVGYYLLHYIPEGEIERKKRFPMTDSKSPLVREVYSSNLYDSAQVITVFGVIDHTSVLFSGFGYKKGGNLAWPSQIPFLESQLRLSILWV